MVGLEACVLKWVEPFELDKGCYTNVILVTYYGKGSVAHSSKAST